MLARHWPGPAKEPAGMDLSVSSRR
jgi:hypothetical protein